MGRNDQDDGYEITQDNIRQVRIDGQKKDHRRHGSKSKNAEEAFYEDVNRQSDRIQELVKQIEAFPNPAIRSLLAECMEAVLTLHGTGLERIFEYLDTPDEPADKIKQRLLEDDFIKGLLLIHGLHPDDLATRLHRALEKVKPYMDSHGGSVEVISLKEGVAKLRLQGSCDGCPSSATTLELGIKQAIEEECPDLLDLQVEGIADNPLAREIRNLNMKSGADTQSKKQVGWTEISGVENLANGDLQAIEVKGISLMICRVDDKLYAYRNECPGCGMSFDSGKLEKGVLYCRLGHDFEVQHAGKNPVDPKIHLDPFPLLEENGIIKVAVG